MFIDVGHLDYTYSQIVRNRKIERLHQQIAWYMQLRKKQTTISGWQKYNKIIQQLEQEIKEIK